MHARLSEKVGEAEDPRPLADDVEEVAMFAGGTVGELAGSSRPRCGAGQPHEERPTVRIPRKMGAYST